MASDDTTTNLTLMLADAAKRAASKHNKARSACVASARDRLEASDARARTQLDALAATQTELVTRRMAELEANTRAQEELYQRMAAVSADFMRTIRSLGRAHVAASAESLRSLETSSAALQTAIQTEHTLIEAAYCTLRSS